MSAQEKQMEVCEVCGAFLIIGDAQTRVDDHLQGKQHMGYAKIKSTIEELKVSDHLARDLPRDYSNQGHLTNWSVKSLHVENRFPTN